MLQSQGQTKRKKIRQHSKKTPRRLLREFATSTWCYGLPALVRSRTRCFRFMWIIAILLSTSACAFMIWQTMSEYLAYTVVTEIESKERRSLIFPQITICGFWLTQPPKMEEIYQVKIKNLLFFFLIYILAIFEILLMLPFFENLPILIFFWNS